MSEKIEYLLIGGGLASAKCARTLREQGAEGRVVIVGREPDPPYNRPDCSKGFLRGEQGREAAYVDEVGYYKEQGIEVLSGTSAARLDPERRTVKLMPGGEVEYGKALIATGANVRRLNVEGCQMEGIHYLRTLGNSEAIRQAASQAQEAVLIGGSYIGCEVAASLSMMGVRCTIVMQERLTLERGFGAEAGSFFQELLQSHGVKIYGEDALGRFEGEGRVARVVTERGAQIPADMVVIGAGVTPDVQVARAGGLAIGETGGVRCDARLETSVPGVFAAGDMCEYDSPIHGGQLRVEHWDVAFNHGETAARNMLGQGVEHRVVPYFFSVLGDWAELEYVGPAREWDTEIVRGAPADGEFTRWYLQEGRVRAALTVGRPDDLEHARRLMASGVELGDDGRAALGDLGSDLESVGS